MSTILEHSDAQELLDQATVQPESLRPCRLRLTNFIARYLPCFVRTELQEHARTILQGKLTSLDRKTTEPIAIQAEKLGRLLQRFLGEGLWSDDARRSEMARHVAQKTAEPPGVLILDPGAFPKKGNQSCGVARQWCSCLGKTDNCQVGVFLAYASSQGKTLVDSELYLPKARAEDPKHRAKTHVPPEVVLQQKWRIGLDLLERRGEELPHGWVCADSELGRVAEFRRELTRRGERYVLDVPCDTLIRDCEEKGPRTEALDQSDSGLTYCCHPASSMSFHEAISASKSSSSVKKHAVKSPTCSGSRHPHSHSSQ